MEKQEVITNLFSSIPIYTEEQIDAILLTMSESDAKIMLIKAIIYAYDRGVYNIGETEVISKAIRVLSKTSEG